MNGSASLLGFILGVAILGLLIWPRVSSAQNDPDAQVLVQLRKAGSNLSKPHPIEFFLYVPTNDVAEKLAAKVRGLGFGATIEPAAQGTKWLVLATKSLVPRQADLVRIRTEFSALAANVGGEYDGWGTPVISE